MLTPVTRSRSLRLSGMACTRTRTSPGPGSGTSTSSRRSTSVGWPCSCMRQARMVVAVMVFAYLFGFEVEVLDVRRELATHLVWINAVLFRFVGVDPVDPLRMFGDLLAHARRPRLAHRQVEGVVDLLDLDELVGDEVREEHVVEHRIRILV